MKTKFNLPKDEQRVIVARDAIRQLTTGVFKAKTGDLMNIGYAAWNEIGYLKSKEQVQGVIRKIKKCSVCARGALLISQIRQFNNMTAHQFAVDAESGLEKLFSQRQINEMEAAFELYNSVSPAACEFGG